MTNRPNDFNFDEDPFGDDNPFNGNGNGNGHDNPPDDFSEFNFDDFGEGSVPEFDFADDDTTLPPGLGDNLDSDMPTLEEDMDSGGTSRTFILLALLMVLLFLGGLALVIVLVLRPTGPTDAELTATQVVMLNQTVEAQFAQTQTQASIFDSMTQTADAYTDTPTATATPTEATRAPTRTPTATLDPTELAGTAQALANLNATELAGTANALAFAQTATALALPTHTPTSAAGLAEFFATQVAFATQQGEAQQAFFGTQVAVLNSGGATQQAINEAVQGTQAAMVTMSAADQELIATALQETQSAASTSVAQQQEALGLAAQAIQATQAALDANVNNVATAIFQVDTGLGNFALTVAPIATQIAQITPEGLATQAAIATLVANATVDAQSTQAALATMIAPTAGNETPEIGTDAVATVNALATQIAEESNVVIATQQAIQTQLAQPTDAPNFDPEAAATLIAVATSVVEQANAAIATQQSLQTQVASGGDTSGQLSEILETQVALATQFAGQGPLVVATQQGVATQVALATRAALVQQALSGTLIAMQQTPTTPPLSGINLTATAIAEAFQLLTQQAPESTSEVGAQPTVGFPTLVPTPSTLPQTGLFDEVSSGANLGVLALMVLGLIGVVFGARYLRSRNTAADMDTPEPVRQQPPAAPEQRESPEDTEDMPGEE